MLWRHGDLLIAAVPSVPERARRRPTAVLAHGELTGHSHRVAETETAELWECEGVLYVRVVAEEARVVHQEHAPIRLPRGSYRVWQQREYTPAAIRRVYD